MINTQDIRKESELTSRILELIDHDMTQSDIQGCIGAVIIDAIRYGRMAELTSRPIGN